MNLKKLMDKKVTPIDHYGIVFDNWTDGLFGIVIYRTQMDDYVLRVYDEVQYFEYNNHFEYGDNHLKGVKIFQTEKECVEYCEQNGIEIVQTEFIYSDLGRGYIKKEYAFDILKDL